MPNVVKQCRAGAVLALLSTVLLAGCQSAEQRSQGYYERGMALLAKGDDLNARVELSTSLKFNSNRIDAWRALAGINERTKAFPSLFQDLRRIVELDPNDTETRLRLARIMLANNGADGAAKLLDGTKESDKARADVHALRAEILLKSNDTAAAVREAEKAISTEPGNPEALLVLAATQFARGDFDGALHRLDAVSAKDDPRVLTLKVQIYGRKGDLPQAESTLKQLIVAKPEFRSQLVQLYIVERKLDEAEKELRSVAAAKPSDIKAGLDVVRFLASFRNANVAREELTNKIEAGGDIFPYQMTLVELDLLEGKIPDAVSLLNGIIKIAGKPEQVFAAKTKLAEIAVSRKEFSTAEPIIADVLAKDSRNTSALRSRALIRLEQGRFDEAIADLREALNNQPKSPDLLLLMATAYERSGKPELADRQYADAVKSANSAPAVVLRYVSFLQARSSISQAEDILVEAAGRNPGNLQILSALAQVRLGRQNWVGALAVADAINATGDKSGVADQIKAAALAGQNKPDASIAALENAHTAAPDAVQPVTSLVSAYLKAGKSDKAEALLRDMLKKFPSNAELFVLLGQVRFC